MKKANEEHPVHIVLRDWSKKQRKHTMHWKKKNRSASSMHRSLYEGKGEEK